MNISFYIANKIAINQKKSFSSFIIRIAIAAIALSTSVMIIGTAITTGYQKIISNKFYDSWGHIHITNFVPEPNQILNDEKIPRDSALINKLSLLPAVKSIHTYTIQSCLLKTKNDIEGVLLKGIDMQANNALEGKVLVEGKKINFNSENYSTEIILSKSLAEKMSLKTHDPVILYFITKDAFQPRARKVNIAGLYSTGLEDYDNHFALCDSRLINNINNEDESLIQGYEIYLKNPNQTEEVQNQISDQFIEAPLKTYTIAQRFSNIFSWLEMMKMNERIIIIIMLTIAVINMITALLILILERTQMIGILKSLGLPNGKIRNVFMFTSLYIISIGVFTGGILGIAFCLLQIHYGIVPLDEKIYYINKVPIFLNPLTVISILSGTIITCLLLLFIPAYIIKTITPTKALKFN